jgi:hypothetical protein
MRTDSERKSVCLRRPNPARKSRGARLEQAIMIVHDKENCDIIKRGHLRNWETHVKSFTERRFK